LAENGIDSISLIPDTVIKTTLALSKGEKSKSGSFLSFLV